MAAASSLIAALEAAVAQDLGKRGVSHLLKQGGLAQAAQYFKDAPSVLILTGFPCVQSEPPTENDGASLLPAEMSQECLSSGEMLAGISGSLALARAALIMGKTVAIVTDDCNGDVLKGCLTCDEYWGELASQQPAGVAPVDVHTFPPKSAWDETQENKLQNLSARFTHFVSVERAGAAANGSYLTMRGRSMNDLIAPLDTIYTTYAPAQGATTTGVGDGGNELGMGAVFEAVKTHIPLGDQIACATSCDALVAAGVSNWGAWGIVAAAHVLGGAPAAQQCALLPSEVAETAMADVMAATGCCDGILGKPGRTVDGMGWHVHTHKLNQLHSIAGAQDADAAAFDGSVSPDASP